MAIESLAYWWLPERAAVMYVESVLVYSAVVVRKKCIRQQAVARAWFGTESSWISRVVMVSARREASKQMPRSRGRGGLGGLSA